MIRKKLLAIVLCAALPFLLAGCGNGKVESTVSEVVSRVGADVSETVSRVESAVESFFEPAGSRLDEEFSSGNRTDGDDESGVIGAESHTPGMESGVSGTESGPLGTGEGDQASSGLK